MKHVVLFLLLSISSSFLLQASLMDEDIFVTIDFSVLSQQQFEDLDLITTTGYKEVEE